MFGWIARFTDGSELRQYDGTKETMFREVENSSVPLKTFSIEDDSGEVYEADLEKGVVDCNKQHKLEELKGETGLSLVYKRRNEVRANEQGEILDARVTHILGLKKGDREITVEVFPGLLQVPRKIEKKDKNLVGKFVEIITDIVKEVKKV